MTAFLSGSLIELVDGDACGETTRVAKSRSQDRRSYTQQREEDRLSYYKIETFIGFAGR